MTEAPNDLEALEDLGRRRGKPGGAGTGASVRSTKTASRPLPP
jgi:hypothetical protein